MCHVHCQSVYSTQIVVGLKLKSNARLGMSKTTALEIEMTAFPNPNPPPGLMSCGGDMMVGPARTSQYICLQVE